MLKIYKNKGVSLIELMVAVGLALVLVLSMLAFYSISLQNVTTAQITNHDQQQLRKIMNLLETDIENTGGFECATHTDIFTDHRMPVNIISLGDNLSRQQIVFAHPVISEYKHTALGMLESSSIQNKTLSKYTPLLIKDAGCGQDKSPVYIGTTVLEMIPITGITTSTDIGIANVANNITAFVALSAAQSRRDEGSETTPLVYTPKMDDATVMFLSNDGTSDVPFGNNKVTISLGFSPENTKENSYIHVPDSTMTDTKLGGWINPFSSLANYNLITDRNEIQKTPDTTFLSKTLHSNSDNTGSQIKTYPLKEDLIKQIRAVKFQFSFGAHGDTPARTLTRVIRFKNTHLMKIGKN